MQKRVLENKVSKGEITYDIFPVGFAQSLLYNWSEIKQFCLGFTSFI